MYTGLISKTVWLKTENIQTDLYAVINVKPSPNVSVSFSLQGSETPDSTMAIFHSSQRRSDMTCLRFHLDLSVPVLIIYAVMASENNLGALVYTKVIYIQSAVDSQCSLLIRLPHTGTGDKRPCQLYRGQKKILFVIHDAYICQKP